MKRVLRKFNLFPDISVLDIDIFLYKDNNGYTVAINNKICGVYPLNKTGYINAFIKFTQEVKRVYEEHQ